MQSQSVQTVPAEANVRKLTFEEYLALGDSAPREWVNGEVLPSIPASVRHQEIVGFLYQLLSLFVQLNTLGIVLMDKVVMRLASNIAREPDIFFLTNENRARLKSTHLDGPADLVVEVVSDESVGRDRADKFYEYQEAGVREYLIIDPRAGRERIDYYFLNAARRYEVILKDANRCFNSMVISGFWFRQEWLTRENLPDALSTLMEIAPEGVRARYNL
jgi:Uma2 family endonuclease